MTDLSGIDLNDPAVRAQLGLEERTEGSPPDLQGQQGQGQGALKHVREALDQTIKAKTEAENEAASLRRELAVRDANLPEFPGKAFFLANYKGDPTAEAIKAAALDAGFTLESPAPTELPSEPTANAVAQAGAPSVSASELAQHRAVAEAAAGSTTGGDVPLDQALLAAKNAAEVLRIVAQAPAEAGLRSVPNVL